MHDSFLFDFSIPQCRVDLLQSAILEHPQPIWFAIPRPIRSCVCNTVDMQFLSNIFGLAPPKSPTPKPASKRRASPLRDSLVHEQEELADIPMEQMNDEDPAPSNAQATKDVDMDQADYDRESDSTVQESDTAKEKKRKEQLLGKSSQPKQEAMPMNPPL